MNFPMSLIRMGTIALVLLVGADSVAFGQEKPAANTAVQGPAKLVRFLETNLSPDGKRVAWVEVVPGKDAAAAAHSAIFIADLPAKPGQARRLTVGDEPSTEQSPVWSPDGEQVAFLSDRGTKGQLQVHVAPAAWGKAQRLTNLKGALADPHWSPDGKQLGLLFTENAPQQLGPVQPAVVETGEIGKTIYYQRLTTIDLASGKVRQVSPADLYVYEYDWAPDSKHCVLSAAPGPGDNNWWVAQLHVLTLASGKTTSILKPDMQIAVPRWSPDGKTIAFIGGLMSDQGATGGDIFTVAAAGGKLRNLTPDLDSSASWLAWGPSSKQLVFTEFIDGGSGIARVDLDGNVNHLWKGAEYLTGAGWSLGVSAARDCQTFALIRQSFQQPPEVWTGPLGKWQAVTQANQGLQPAWGKATSLNWKSDSFKIQGWLLYPEKFDPKGRYPLVVDVHGGPAWAVTPHWQDEYSVVAALSRQGYFVLLPNPRGSYGQGEKFTRANVKDLGHGDWRDILAGVDEVLRVAPVDKDRLGIGGWSYGGYMTMWGVTQTDRFRAAVAGAGIANWQSYYGQNGIDQWMIPYFGASAYDDPAIYARSSPITFIKKVKTPTLILVGERDSECPLPQSQEFYHALKTLKVPTKLVVYAGEGHGVAKREHRLDIVKRWVEWFDQKLQPAPVKALPQRAGPAKPKGLPLSKWQLPYRLPTTDRRVEQPGSSQGS
jgi:dipeptidyl aminopeptidase/acylaminoacyl peptidase